MQYFLTNPAAVRAACLVEHLDDDPLGVRMATPAGSPPRGSVAASLPPASTV